MGDQDSISGGDLMRTEYSFVNQLPAVGNPVVEIDSQGRDGCPAHRCPAHKAQVIPAEVMMPSMAPEIEE